jgi:hypothetical protein
MPNKPKKYSGILAKPIDLREQPFGTDSDVFIREEILKKIPALLDHCDVDDALTLEKKWYQVALKLAFAHVPGFDVTSSKRKGRKRKWTVEESQALVNAIHAEKTTKGLKVAIRLATKRPQWRWSKSVASIQARYHEAVQQIKQHEWPRNHPDGILGALMDWDAAPGNRPSRNRTTKKPG